MEQVKMKTDRDYRRFETFELRAAEDEKELFVEGYALTFEQPTVLYENNGVQYSENIQRGALNGADLSDVIFNYNHMGKVMARTRNKTLDLSINDKGLFIRARLDGTEEGRRLYEEIRGGYIDRMSFSFRIEEDSYDQKSRTRNISKIKKLYDVSAVDIPAYDTTSISARSFFDAVAENERKAADAAIKRKKLILKSISL
jgi:uncharacterized protein